MKSRNIPLLAISQAFASLGPPMVLLVAGFIGADLAPSPELSTLPIFTMVVGVAIFTVPAALIMQKFGRRRGFIAAALLAAAASVGAVYAIYIDDFILFCAMLVFIGANAAFVNQYRFAAAESVQPDQAARAVSFILLSGIAAGYLGPEIGKQARDWLPSGAFIGSFFLLALAYLVAVLFLMFLRDTAILSQPVGSSTRRPLRSIAVQPSFWVAVLLAMVAYAVMSMIMTATPISMHRMDGYSLDQTTFVIQSHIMAMYLPSLVTGFLFTRFGALKIAAAGIVCMLATVLVSFTSQLLPAYWLGLVLLGAGWNFLFVGGTVLLTESYRFEERFKAQAANDFLVFTVQALASLSAGAILFHSGWKTVNLLALPLLTVAALAILFLSRQSHPSPETTLPA